MRLQQGAHVCSTRTSQDVLLPSRSLTRPPGIQPSLRTQLAYKTVAAHAHASQPSGLLPNSSGQRPALLRWLPDKQAVNLVTDAWALLYSNIWAVVFVFLMKDAAAFILHRVAHRLTNHIAEMVLGIPISSMGNPWWIMADAKFMEGHVGYQVLVGCFFLLCLPVNILFNTAAVSTAAVVCTARRAIMSPPAVPGASWAAQGSGKVGVAECRSTTSSLDMEEVASSGGFSSRRGSSDSSMAGAAACSGTVSFAGSGCGSVSFRTGSSRNKTSSSSSTSTSSGSSSAKSKRDNSGPLVLPATAPAVPWLASARQQHVTPKPLGIKPSIAMVKETWAKQVVGRLRQLWLVDILFNMWSLPLQAACLAVVPAFWAFPRLLEIQLSLPAAVLSGQRGKQALEQSKQLMAGFKTTYAWPFVWLIVAGRLLELVKEVVLVSMPVRWWTDVVEVPLVATAFFAVARLLLSRLQDLVPLAAYLHRAAAAGAASV